MPLTEIQKKIIFVLSHNRTESSHLAGGAALHFEPNSIRYSEDLDYFHDSEKAVAEAFEKDHATLVSNGFHVSIEITQLGYIRATVSLKSQASKIEWAQDSIWRFMPVKKHPEIGYVLDPIDLVINKLLALAGRDEPRDYLDVIMNHNAMLPLGAQLWAACGKDPGFSPHSLLELIKRRGHYHQEDFDRLHLQKPASVKELKIQWLMMLESATKFIELAPADSLGALFYNTKQFCFFEPTLEEFKQSTTQPHFAKKYGVLPSAL